MFVHRAPFANLEVPTVQYVSYSSHFSIITDLCGIQQNGDEFVHLPAIVETAECSPNAAKEAAYRIRKYLGSPTSPHAYVQYNAIMLFRILVDNPGHTFTRNIDAKFVSTVRGIVRDGRDMNVQRFLCETLEALEARRSWDEDLGPLLEMWKKEKGSLRGKAVRVSGKLV